MSQSDRPIDAIEFPLGQSVPDAAASPVETEAAPLAQLGAQAEEQSRRAASLWGDAWRRLVRNRLAVIGMVIVVGFVILAIAGPGLHIGGRTVIPAIAPYGESEVVDVRL